MTFKDCKNAGSCGKDLCLPEFCHQFDPIQKTNADRIREMSDEEMAVFLHRHNNCRICEHFPTCSFEECEDGISKWLQQPAGVKK